MDLFYLIFAICCAVKSVLFLMVFLCRDVPQITACKNCTQHYSKQWLRYALYACYDTEVYTLDNAIIQEVYPDDFMFCGIFWIVCELIWLGTDGFWIGSQFTGNELLERIAYHVNHFSISFNVILDMVFLILVSIYYSRREYGYSQQFYGYSYDVTVNAIAIEYAINPTDVTAAKMTFIFYKFIVDEFFAFTLFLYNCIMRCCIMR